MALSTWYSNSSTRESRSPNKTPISSMITQSVDVINGLFTAPLMFDPTNFLSDGALYLDIGVKPTNQINFVHFNEPLPISPSPLAIHAAVADSIIGLDPGQAVTSLNGLQDDLMLVAGSNITISSRSNALVIDASSSPGPPGPPG